MSYQVIKLSNGEDIVCNVLELHNTQLKITAPLKMDTISKETGKGFVESLALSRWVQPYSDEETFTVERNSIVIMTPASHGLARYYEYVLQNINEVVQRNRPTVKQLKKIEEEEEQMDLEEDLVSSEDLEAILDNFNTKKTYH